MELSCAITAGTILIVLCSTVFPMIVGMVIVLVSPDVTVAANVVCSDKMLLNVVMMLSIFGVDKLMGFCSMGSCSTVFVTRTESVKNTQTS